MTNLILCAVGFHAVAIPALQSEDEEAQPVVSEEAPVSRHGGVGGPVAGGVRAVQPEAEAQHLERNVGSKPKLAHVKKIFEHVSYSLWVQLVFILQYPLCENELVALSVYSHL